MRLSKYFINKQDFKSKTLLCLLLKGTFFSINSSRMLQLK